MKHKNAGRVLPKELVAAIQEYVQGEYLYIPLRDKPAPAITDYRMELVKRDARIYSKYLEGMCPRQLAEHYSLSPSSIRRILRRERSAHMAMHDTIQRALTHWGLQNEAVKQISDTAWQAGDAWVVKIYRDSHTLKRNWDILRVLDGMQIPVGKPVPTDSGQPYAAAEDTFYLLTEKLPGRCLLDSGEIQDTAGKLGEILARLHIAFQTCGDTISFRDSSLLDEMNGWVRKSLEDGGWRYVSQQEYEAAVSALAAVYCELPVQPIHRDVHFGNFLFANGSFSGYIDFDLSQRNIRIFDLCYFLLGLLSEEEKLEITEEEWFRTASAVFGGYESRLELSEVERRAVPWVMECIELLFTAYFSGEEDSRCAEDASRIFRFVRRQEHRIRSSIRRKNPAANGRP